MAKTLTERTVTLFACPYFGTIFQKLEDYLWYSGGEHDYLLTDPDPEWQCAQYEDLSDLLEWMLQPDKEAYVISIS